MTELDALLVLNGIPGLGNSKKKKLISYYGSALKVLSLSSKDLSESGNLSSKMISNILHFSKDKFLKDEYTLIEAEKVSILNEADDSYPDLLKEIDDNPIILYMKGKIPENINLSISIVGSRRASLAGRLIAEKFAYAFSEYGFTVVSGLARGIDTAAHTGALSAKGSTVAVLGSGLSCVYPKENKNLFEEIAFTTAVISEHPMRTSPLPFNFPRRNRIISGISLGVIVVEAAMRSGALITADFALQQGREVFAVPGNIGNFTSEGVNNLIKQGAKIVTCIDDVLGDLSENIKCFLHPSEDKSKTNRLGPKDSIELISKINDLETDESLIYKCLNDSPTHIDDLVRQCGFSSSFASSVLLQLELKNRIKQLPGKLFTKL